jgi:hypothetical protein
VTIRWPLLASITALFAGAGLAALVLAVCSESAEGPVDLEVRATARALVTRTPTSQILAATQTAPEPTAIPVEEEPPPI